jgi:hypothetical protein
MIPRGQKNVEPSASALALGHVTVHLKLALSMFVNASNIISDA